MTIKRRPTPAARAVPTPQRLREIAWEAGTRFPRGFTGDHVALAMVRPRHGYLHWHVLQSTSDRLGDELGQAFSEARLIVRIHDVTDIVFDGRNAHMSFDLEVSPLHGKRYFPVNHVARNLLAEVGFRLRDGSLHVLARSGPAFFDRDRPSGRFDLSGLYVDAQFRRVLPVENVLDAPVYERLHRQLTSYHREQPLVVAAVHLDTDPVIRADTRLARSIDALLDRCAKFGVRGARLGPAPDQAVASTRAEALEELAVRTETLFERLRAHHARDAFELVHCHNWDAIPLALRSQEELGLPFLLTLHSTEHERARTPEMDPLSACVCEWERRGSERASLIIVPHSSTRHQVVTLYDAPAERVTIIEHPHQDTAAPVVDPAEAKRNLGLNPDWPVVLFSGEMSHATGADLLMDALITVCRDHGQVQFAFAGEGPLRQEIEGRAWRAGLAHRCRFLGDVPGHRFDAVLIGCDFVCIPARTWQDEGLAQKALALGKPVLTTHQSQIRCIQHGQTGLVTYDNPGSIIWGLKELLANPLRGSMATMLSRRGSDRGPSLETSAAEHYLAFERALAEARGEAT